MAVLSGLALFTPLHTYQGEWLDAMFLVAVLVALLAMLSLIVRAAARSFQRRIDNPDQDRSRRKR